MRVQEQVRERVQEQVYPGKCTQEVYTGRVQAG